MRTASRLHRWTIVPVVALVVLALLLVAIAAGLRVPGVTQLRGMPVLGGLDYRTLAGGSFQPLRADYVDQLLGTNLGDPAPVADDAGIANVQPLGASDAAPAGPAAAADRAQVLEHDFTNDDMRSPVVIGGLPFTGRTDTSRATRQAGEPASCAPSGGTAWYRYTARHDGVLFADTFGSDHATAIGVFTGEPGVSVEQVGCATGPTNNAQVGFSAVRGRVYFFQVAGLVSGGRLVFHLRALGRTSLASPAAPSRNPGGARQASVSGDGRIVVFEGGPLECDYCAVQQVFAYDRQTGVTTLVSRGLHGESGTSYAIDPSISENGRFVSFSSGSSNLVEGDTNNTSDVFVRDLHTGRTVRASVSSSGQQAVAPANYSDGPSGSSMSADGRYVVFDTGHDGLVDGASGNGHSQVYLRDLRTGVTTRESEDDKGQAGRAYSGDARVSADGRYVAFLSANRRLARAAYRDCDALTVCQDVFVRDRRTGSTRIVSVDRDGRADSAALRLDMSSDGRVVAWSTDYPLDPRDTNGVFDVYAVDTRGSGRPRWVSRPTSADQPDDPGNPTSPADASDVFQKGYFNNLTVSGDGTRIAYSSRSTNLVPGDTNARSDIFLCELGTGVTTRVSVGPQGGEGDDDSYRPELSRDGRVVVFESDATNLVSGDENHVSDVFVHDLSDR